MYYVEMYQQLNVSPLLSVCHPKSGSVRHSKHPDTTHVNNTTSSNSFCDPCVFHQLSTDRRRGLQQQHRTQPFIALSNGATIDSLIHFLDIENENAIHNTFRHFSVGMHRCRRQWVFYRACSSRPCWKTANELSAV